MKPNEEFKKYLEKVEADLLAMYMKSPRDFNLKTDEEYFPQFVEAMKKFTLTVSNIELSELVRKIEDMGWEVTLKLKKDAL